MAKISSIFKIPFLPISFYKNFAIKTGEFRAQAIFKSSGTTGSIPSRHFVRDVFFYEENTQCIFQNFYGNVKDFCVLALLPSYLERENSSLVFMADRFIKKSTDSDSGFFLDDLEKLHAILLQKIKEKKPTVLLGVTFGLLDFAQQFSLPKNNLILMETGGMKGRRRELLRTEVHKLLCKNLGVNQIHSEYGMTELFGQAYSHKDGIFETPPWMRVLIRQTDDPFSYEKTGKTGGINVIDLGNLDSCCFVETQDLGRNIGGTRFEVMGRFDNSEVRGCNLMVI